MNFLKNWYDKTVAFLKEVRHELAFVTWPTREEVKDSTKIVFVTVFVLSMYIAVLDALLTEAFRFIAGLSG